MESGSITSKDIIGWIVAIAISLIGSIVPLLIEINKVKKCYTKKLLPERI